MKKNPDGHYQRIGEIVSIFHRGGVWYANYQHNGKQVRRSLKTNSKKEARRRAIQLEADLQSGRYQTQAKAPRIEEVIKAHISYLRTEGRSYDTIRNQNWLAIGYSN